MNKMEELEFLIELQGLSLGTISHNEIEVYCKDFQRYEKNNKLETKIVINVRKIDWEKAGNYIQGFLYNGRIRVDIENFIINKIKEIMEEKTINLRREIRENLGIQEGPLTEIKIDHDISGGGNTI